MNLHIVKSLKSIDLAFHTKKTKKTLFPLQVVDLLKIKKSPAITHSQGSELETFSKLEFVINFVISL